MVLAIMYIGMLLIQQLTVKEHYTTALLGEKYFYSEMIMYTFKQIIIL